MTTLQVLLSKDPEHADQSDFQLYWEKIERAEKAYAAYERKRAKIVDRFNQELLPIEQALAQVHFQFIEQLLGHLAKKSLGIGDKEELIHWISRECGRLSNSPFRAGLNLDAVMKQLHQHELALVKRNPETERQMKIDMQDEILHLFMEQGIDPAHVNMDEFIAAFEEGPQQFFELFIKYATQHAAENGTFEEGVYEEDDGGDAFQSETSHDYRSHSEEPSSEEMSQQQLSLLFKRLAQKLHPDRATNDVDRELRHNLMLQLNKARKENDVYTLLQLVRDFGDAVDAKLSEGQLTHLTGHLEAKLVELRIKKRQLKTDSTVDAMIFDNFHASSNSKIDQKFSAAKISLRENIAELQQLIISTSSLKKVKQALERRRPEFLWQMFDI